MNKQITKHCEVEVEVVGIKKRARKTARHRIHVVNFNDDGVMEFDLDNDMKAKVSTTVHREMREVNSPIVVHFYPFTVEHEGHVQIKTMQIPHHRYKRFVL